MVRPEGKDPVCDGHVQGRDEMWKCMVSDRAVEKKVYEVWGEKGLEVACIERVDGNTERAHQREIVCGG